MYLNIFSPEKTCYKGETDYVSLPGTNGPFVVLNMHTPIISTLEKGKITYSFEGKMAELQILNGFVEVRKDIITICVELNTNVDEE